MKFLENSKNKNVSEYGPWSILHLHDMEEYSTHLPPCSFKAILTICQVNCLLKQDKNVDAIQQ